MLENLADHSRIWVFQSERKLTQEEENFIHDVLTDFIKGWASHGDDVFGGFNISHSLFVVAGADERKTALGGCSIDSLHGIMKELGKKLNIDFFNRLNIACMNADGEVELLNMAEFKSRAKKDEITGQTIVFNNLIETKADLSDKWKTSVKNSWHKNLLEIY